MDISTFCHNNCIDEEEALEQAYDIFLELAADNLDPADILLFNLQFEQSGAAETVALSDQWADYIDVELDPAYFSEIIIGLTNDSDEIDDIFARILLCREKDHKYCHILWKS